MDITSPLQQPRICAHLAYLDILDYMEINLQESNLQTFCKLRGKELHGIHRINYETVYEDDCSMPFFFFSQHPPKHKYKHFKIYPNNSLKLNSEFGRRPGDLYRIYMSKICPAPFFC